MEHYFKLQSSGERQGSNCLTSLWPGSAEAAQNPEQTCGHRTTAQTTHGSQRSGAFSFLSPMWAFSIMTKPDRFLKIVVKAPNIAGTFKKIILAKSSGLISDFLWVLGPLGAGRGTWRPSLNYTHVSSLLLLSQGDEWCLSALPPNPKQSSYKAAKWAPVFLHQMESSGRNKHSAAQTLNVQSHYGLSFLPNIVRPWTVNRKR